MVREAIATVWEKDEIDRSKRVRQELAQNRPAIYQALVERDGEHCDLCDSTYRLTIDHVQQVINGGPNELDNLRLLCQSCNGQEKGVSKENRLCALCGQSALMKFSTHWLCSDHFLEASTISEQTNMSRDMAFKQLRQKYGV